MAWCRWSTDIDNERQSDLYIYESVANTITVHVAGRRRINYKDNPYNDKRSILELKEHEIVKWSENQQKHSDWMNKNTVWEDLPETYAGKTFEFGYDDDELTALKMFLDQCEIDGINFPKYIFVYIEETRKEHKS